MTRGSEAEAVSFGDPDREPARRGAQRAKSLTSDFPLPPAPTLLPVTRSDAPPWVRTWAERLEAWLRGLSSGAHLTEARPSMTEARARVHAAGDRYEAWAGKALRYLWGYLWLGLKAGLNFTEWVTESPSRAITAAVLITLAVFFH